MFATNPLDAKPKFSSNLHSYDENALVQIEMAKHLINMLKEHSNSLIFDSVLDLGCGTGLLIKEFVNSFSYNKLYLYDIVPECAKYVENYGCFKTMDFNNPTSFENAELVLSGACIQWLDNPSLLFNQINDALHQNGLFVGSSFVEGNLHELAACGGAPLKCKKLIQYKNILEESGFEVLDIESDSIVLYFNSVKEAMYHLRKTGVMISVLKSHAEIVKFVKKYEQLRTTEGKIPLTYHPCYWVVRKK